MKMIVLGLALAAVPISAIAGTNVQSMNAEVFYKRATALKKKGPMALFSRGEIKALMDEAKSAGAKARAHRMAAIEAGKPPAYCPPQASVSLNSNEFMAHISAIPAAERARMDMAQAMLRILAAKYPCRG